MADVLACPITGVECDFAEYCGSLLHQNNVDVIRREFNLYKLEEDVNKIDPTDMIPILDNFCANSIMRHMGKIASDPKYDVVTQTYALLAADKVRSNRKRL